MQTFKSAIFIAMLCLHQPALRAQITNTSAKHFSLEKIIYHRGGCYGNCSTMDLQIDQNRNILVRRQVFDTNGVADRQLTGNFKGKLDTQIFNNLIDTLIACDYANLKFPPDSCCDIPLITIIVYANGKRTRLSSIFPPEESKGLINLLHDIGMQTDFPPTNEQVKLEQ